MLIDRGLFPHRGGSRTARSDIAMAKNLHACAALRVVRESDEAVDRSVKRVVTGEHHGYETMVMSDARP